MRFEHGAELPQPGMQHRHVGKGTTRLQRDCYAPPEHVLVFANVELQLFAPTDVVRPTFMGGSERVPGRSPLQRTAGLADVLQAAETVSGCEVVEDRKDVVQVHGRVSPQGRASANAAGTSPSWKASCAPPAAATASAHSPLGVLADALSIRWV